MIYHLKEMLRSSNESKLQTSAFFMKDVTIDVIEKISEISE